MKEDFYRWFYDYCRTHQYIKVSYAIREYKNPDKIDLRTLAQYAAFIIGDLHRAGKIEKWNSRTWVKTSDDHLLKERIDPNV